MPRKRKDLTGQKFGRWEVLSSPDGGQHWTCRCGCGTERDVRVDLLTTGRSTGCHSSCTGVALDLTGQRFGEWTVVQKGPPGTNGEASWVCECSCGQRNDVKQRFLLGGRSAGCGRHRGKVSVMMRERAPKYDFGGQMLSVSEVAVLADRSDDAIRRRMKAGMTPWEAAFGPGRKKPSKYTLHGKPVSLTELAKAAGCCRFTAARRIQEGWTPERLVQREA